MTAPSALRLAAAVALAALAPAASAQMLPSGTWTGTLEADGEARPVEAAVERCATGFKVALTVAGRTAETETATWERGRLQFRLPRLRLPGALLPRALACDLRQRDDGALAGTCTAGRADYRLRLSPPAEAAFGCD